MTYEIEASSTSGPGRDLVLVGDWSADARAAIERSSADGLVLNYARGFREQPIDFVRGLPLRKLDLLARSVDDLEPIYSLSQTLEELRVQSEPRVPIDLERLPRLRVLAAPWPQIRHSIMFAPQLEDLAAPSYSERDLEPLSMLGSLTSLVMKERPKLESLVGLAQFPWLIRLGIHMASRLSDISGLAAARLAVLQVLQLTSCKRISSIDAVAGCTSLQFLDVSEAAEIASVAPLSDLVNLERLYLYGSTRIADGDLSPIAALPKLKDLRIRSRRSYFPSVGAIERQIEGRA